MTNNFLLNKCIVFWIVGASHGWTSQSTSPSAPPQASAIRRSNVRSIPFRSTRLYEKPIGGEMEEKSSSDEQKQEKGNWLEEWALEGASKIAKLDLHERTQRAMLAEMVEDKIYENSITLEKLLDEDTGEITDREAAKEIAMQTRSLQGQYKALVTGEDSTILKAMASLKETDSRNDDD
jgi:hypothetical protein